MRWRSKTAVAACGVALARGWHAVGRRRTGQQHPKRRMADPVHVPEHRK